MKVTPTYITMTKTEFAAIRAELGFTQGELARALYMARNYINELENGRRPISTHVALDMLALQFGFRPPEITPRRQRKPRTVLPSAQPDATKGRSKRG